MSREKRRQEERLRRRAERAGFSIIKRDDRVRPEEADFSEVSPAMLCSSIQLLLNELQKRGVRIYDFDHKKPSLFQIQFIKGVAYFLAAEEGDDE